MKKKAASLKRRFVILMAFCMACAYVSALFVTHVAAQGGHFFFALRKALTTFIPHVFAHPTAINLSHIYVRGIILFWCIAVPLLALVLASRGHKGNFDTGKEHGSERLATKKEMMALTDKRHFWNNAIVSQHVGIAIFPWSRRLKKALHAVNKNVIIMGISGLGKTYHLIMPNLLQALGCTIEPIYSTVPNKILNIMEHVFKRPIKRNRARKTIRKYVTTNHLPSEGQSQDIFVTDTKGDTLRDVGSAYVQSGYDIKIFNTIDFKDSMRYNPLAYIPTVEIDLEEIENIETTIKGNLSSPSIGDANFSCPFCVDSTTAWSKSFGVDDGVPSPISIAVKTKSVEKPTNENGLHRDWLFDQLKSENCEKTAEILESVKYTRSTLTYTIAIENVSWQPLNGKIEVHLDPALELDYVTFSGGTIDEHFSRYQENHVFEWLLSDVEGTATCEITCRIASFRVPDAVALTKTVDCLIANLKNEHDVSAKADPFWEDAKRLTFLALCSAVFEWYEPEHRNLGVVMDLLDMALADSGVPTDPSPLSILMDRWEYGHIYTEEHLGIEDAGMRSGKARGRYKRADNPPHSRSRSLALHCYRAISAAAPETVQSVIVTAQTAFVHLLGPDVRYLLSRDEMRLDTFGDPDQKQAIFVVVKDVDNPYGFLVALLCHQLIDLTLDKAYKKYGGTLPRHCRLLIDEAMTIGKIPILIRAIAIMRSRNMSLLLAMQAKSQCDKVYGKNETKILFDNASTLVYLGSQTEDTLKTFSEMLGKETVLSRVFQRSFAPEKLAASKQEHITSTGRSLKSPAELRRMNQKMLVFTFGRRPAIDDKFNPTDHPYFPYICPHTPRSWMRPLPRTHERFDVHAYLGKKRKEKTGDKNA